MRGRGGLAQDRRAGQGLRLGREEAGDALLSQGPGCRRGVARGAFESTWNAIDATRLAHRSPRAGWGQAKLRAAYACKGACGGPCQDAGTEAWHKTNDETKGCAWVSIFPAMRCLVKGEGGVRATEACPDSCARNHVVVGGPDGSGDKNCCGGGSACGLSVCF